MTWGPTDEGKPVVTDFDGSMVNIRVDSGYVELDLSVDGIHVGVTLKPGEALTVATALQRAVNKAETARRWTVGGDR